MIRESLPLLSDFISLMNLILAHPSRRSLTPIDRVHMAATDFRTGRIWPPASSNVRFLWDQVWLLLPLAMLTL